MKMLTTFGALAFIVAAPVAATTIDFTAMAPGPVTTIGDVSFAMSGGPNPSTTPVVVGVFEDSTVSLTNSDTNDYPTNAFLTATFGTATSGIRFTFNNYGTENGSFYTAYDGLGGIVSTGLIENVNNFDTVFVSGSGIKTLVWSNNTGGQDNWQFGVGSLTFGVVPEPGSWALMIVGFGLVGTAARRRQNLSASFA